MPISCTIFKLKSSRLVLHKLTQSMHTSQRNSTNSLIENPDHRDSEKTRLPESILGSTDFGEKRGFPIFPNFSIFYDLSDAKKNFRGRKISA